MTQREGLVLTDGLVFLHGSDKNMLLLQMHWKIVASQTDCDNSKTAARL
jgi:hypothetical protein